MQLSNTTTKDGLLQRYEDYTNLDDGVVTSDTTLKAKAVVDLNETIFDLTTEIMISDDDFQWDDPNRTDYAVATTPLVANQRDYQFDNLSFLSLRRVDVSYDGTTFYRATPWDSSQEFDGIGNDTTVDNRFSRTEPVYDPKAFGFWLYPRATATDVANGGLIRIEFNRAFDVFTTTSADTKEPPIDRPWHDLIAMGAAGKYLIRKGDRRAGNLVALYEQGKQKMLSYYGRRNEDAQLLFNPQVDDYS